MNLQKRPIYLITTRPLYPINGGDRVRLKTLLELCQSLGETKIIFNTLWYENLNETKSQLLKKKIEFYHFKIGPFQFLKNAISCLFVYKPIQNLLYVNPILQFFKIPNEAYKVYHLSRSLNCSSPKPTNTLIDLTDNLLLHYKKVKFNWTLKSLIFILERNRIRHFYASLDQNLNISVISERDKIFPKNIILNNPAIFKTSVYDSKSKNILFIGNMNSYPNKQAVFSFIESNSFLFSKKGYVLYILGKGSSKINFSENRNIIKIEYYQSLEKLNLLFCFGIAPMLSGAGVQNKILDYTSYGLPTITTSISAKAIPDGENILVEDNLANYSNIIVSKHYSKTKLTIMCKRYLEKHFSFNEIKRVFIASFKND